jgi:signal transduction histidine kinase
VYKAIIVRAGVSAPREATRAHSVDGRSLGSGLTLLKAVPTASSCLLNANAVGLFFLLLLFPALAITQHASAQSATTLFCLTNAQKIRGLSPEEAQKGFPVRLYGTVTYYDAPLQNLFLQDATAGVFLLVAPNVSTNITAGQEIEVEGVSDKGDYAPIVRASAIHILGKANLPIPRRVSGDQLFTGMEDSQWIEVSGVVRSATILDGRRYLNFAMSGQRIMAYVQNLSQSDAMKLINATVRLRGVCYSRYNMKRQLRVPWLAISSRTNIVVEKPPPGLPKEVSIASLAQFNSVGYYGNLVKVSGVVTLQKSDGGLFIQNRGYGLYVQLAQSAKLVPGDHVTVSGYSALEQYVPILEDATVQFLSQGNPPSPIATDLSTLLNAPEDSDGLLVRVEASLMNLVESAGRETLVLESSNSVFTATLENVDADEHFKSLKIGSQISLTGVFVAKSPEKWVPGVAESREPSTTKIPTPPPESIQVLLRSYADIAVIHQPPWWTLSRLLWTLGIMSFVIVAGLAWVVVLDRRVRQQTQIIQQKVRREGVLEERDRIAREFHDTLEQELAGISIQLGTVEAQFRESPQVAFQQLELARNMARHSLSEARRSVWDLRSHLLENSNLATALAGMVAPLSTSTGVEIAVQSFGAPEKLPALTEHNLLRIAQEASANALKHSSAKKIVVGLNYETKQVQLSIRDDGTGFDVQSAWSANGGHFGLLDMRERAEKIGARFSLITKRGSGTEILVTVTNAAFVEPAGYSPNHANPTAPVKDGIG